MKHNAHSYGRGFQLGTLGALIGFCMKSNMIKTKVLMGFLYTYWISHCYTLGSHLGLYLNLKCNILACIIYTKVIAACDQLNMDPKFQTGRYTQELIKKIRELNERYAQGLPTPSENDFLREFMFFEQPEKVKENYGDNSYTANDYFSKNYEKYMKTDASDDDPNKVFNPTMTSYDDKLKLPILDCFLSRYLYHNTARWLRRFKTLAGFDN